MSSIVFADLTGAYDGRSLEEKPLGGTESSVIRLSRELASRGHEVTAYTHCDEPHEHKGVSWRPITGEPDPTCDLYIPVQQPRLFGYVRQPAQMALWVLWQPNNLKHYKQIWRVWRYRPRLIMMSRHQQAIYSPLLPSRRGEIFLPLGLPDDVRGHGPLSTPPPRRAIFASNPSRNLRRLVQIWAERIHPRVPDAVLDIYGVNGLQDGQNGWDVWEGNYLPPGLSPEAKASIQIHQPVSRLELMRAMREARVMPYLGHKSEAFCLVLAEAQALGLPAVVARIAAIPERVIDGVTGFHRDDDESIAEATIALLTDDDLWRKQHEAALNQQQGSSWSDYADGFEASLGLRTDVAADGARPGA